MIRLMTVAVRTEQDVVNARQRARHIAQLLGFETQDQARVATAVSEIVRNAFRYAGGGEVQFLVEGERPPQLLSVQVTDQGDGIPHLQEVLDGNYRSATGMGLGIVGARRLMDHFAIRPTTKGTTVTMQKLLPPASGLLTKADAGRIGKALAAHGAVSPIDEVQQQNRELLRTLQELRERQEELEAVNRELEDTNRGVVALYAELEERADFLRRADETKSRFLSNMSHEFRTPLNSIRALTQILLDKSDGPLTGEQELQLNFVRSAAQSLTELVDDLLDIAKIEAGKIDVRPATFSVSDLFSALRGMLRPLLVSDKVALRFDAAPDLPQLVSDEGKLSQILRNLISNALKFTERGEIRVTAYLSADHEQVEFSVADTGIGIANEDQARIFEEFVQVRNPLQSRVKGTGLGLPLCRRLATVLGGSIGVESTPGVGSTFTVRLPVRLPSAAPDVPLAPEQLVLDPQLIPVLVVEDHPDEQLVYQKMLRGTAYGPISAHNLRQAREALQKAQPAAVLLDVQLGYETTWKWLGELKSDPATAALPIIVITSVDDPRKSYALGADAYLDKPVGRDALVDALNELTRAKVLIIDDDPASRYTIRKCLQDAPYHVLEAANAREGMQAATTMRPELIVLDLNLPDRRGEEVLRELSGGEATSAIPVIVATAESLTSTLLEQLGDAAGVFSKSELN
ncbi:MAG TPA: ATP-binding protein, partial [Burkholderiales bacterium]|nr:ATP-binding protein [Burkholderiales bacterium]